MDLYLFVGLGYFREMYERIGREARGLWYQGPLGKAAAVVLVLVASVGISASRLLFKTAVTQSVVGCGLDEAAMKQRAQRLLDVLDVEYGKGKRLPGGADRLVFENAKFDIAYVDMVDPCQDFFAIRVPIEGLVASPLPPKKLLPILEDRNIGGKYESGLGGMFVYDDDLKAYYLSYIVRLTQLGDGGIVREVRERQSLGEAWRKGWFEEVWRIAMGEAQAPKENMYRPGRDPESVLRGVDAFLKDAGQQGVYP